MLDHDRAQHPYIPDTLEQVRDGLRLLGITSLDDLFPDIPRNLLNPKLVLPAPMNELQLSTHMAKLAARNEAGLPSFLGAGDYDHFVPSVVGRVTALPGFFSAYTPYQPEISQGTLTSAFEYQTMVCELTGMDVSNTGMYDGGSSLAEAALMAKRITGRSRVVALDTVHPNDLRTVKTYQLGKENVTLDFVSPDNTDVLDDSTACVLMQSPNYFGYVEDQRRWIEAAHNVGALGVVSINNILSLGLLKPPGEYGADIVVGEGSSIGSPVIFGGANLGIFTTREKYLRAMPGRIVGKTNDAQDRTGYVLTIQPREQHIKREKATSNICTAEQLIALGFAVHLALLGPEGFRELAKLNYDKAHYAAAEIAKIPGFKLPIRGTFFNEFVAECPKSPTEINKKLLEGKDDEKMIGGLDVSDRQHNRMLICVTEFHSREIIDQFVDRLRKVAA